MSERIKRAFCFDYDSKKHGISEDRLRYMQGRLVGIVQTVLDGEKHPVRTKTTRKADSNFVSVLYINATKEEMEKIERIFNVHKVFTRAITVISN